MTDLYPPSPAQPPEGLRATPPHYWARLAGAVSAVALLGAAWLALVGVMLWPAWRAVDAWRNAEPAGDFVLTGLFGLFVAAVLLVPLTAVKRIQPPDAVEVTADTEPDLVLFIHRVATEAGAPLPHRIWLVPTVNAAVMFDVSPLALIFPTRKSLLLGVGLVNTLTLDELKAVLAHEFGHFAQGSMRVGAWVYVAHQVAGNLITQRTALDQFVSALSRFDPRIAWIGWLLSLTIGAVRVVTEALFALVLRFDRALSREMELQADRVAVRVAGSDSVVHSLARLRAADEALDLAIAQFAHLLESGVQPQDIYAMQSHLIGRIGAVRHEAAYGATPVRPEPPDPAHRVFGRDLVVSPRMYATHPPLAAREDNAKAIYVPSTLDARSAWALFRDPEATRREVTLHHLGALDDKQRPTIENDEMIRRVDERLDHLGFNPRHRGLYLDRPATRYARTPDDVLPATPAAAPAREAVLAQIEAAWSDTLGDLLKTRRNRLSEVDTLRALKNGDLEAPGRRVEFRGQVHSPRRLDGVLAEVEGELEQVEQQLCQQDRQIRAAHRLAATALGPDARAEHRGLVAFLHYAEHTLALLHDEKRVLEAVWSHVLRDGKLSSSERATLLSAFQRTHEALVAVHGQAGEVVAPAAVALREPGLASWTEWMYGAKVTHAHAPQELDPEWIDQFVPFVTATLRRLSDTVNIALDALLDTEDAMAAALREGLPYPAGAPGSVPGRYAFLLRGDEQAKPFPPTLTDRVILGIGPFWGPVRTVAATTVVAGVAVVMVALGPVTRPTLVVANGFNRPLHVQIDGVVSTVPARSVVSSAIRAGGGAVHLRAVTADGQVVEERSEPAWRGEAVWSVARGAAFAVTTGSDPTPSFTTWGFERCADCRVAGAPVRLARGRTGPARTLQGIGFGQGGGAAISATAVLTPDELGPWATAHLRWDDAADDTIFVTRAAMDAGSADATLALAGDPTLRASQRFAMLTALNQPELAQVHSGLQAYADANPRDVDAAWLAVFSRPAGEARDQALDALLVNEPNPLVATRRMTQARAQGRFAEADQIWQQILKAAPEVAHAFEGEHMHDLIAMGKVDDLIAESAASPSAYMVLTAAALSPANKVVSKAPKGNADFEALRALGGGRVEAARAQLSKISPDGFARWALAISDGGTETERLALAGADPATAHGSVVPWGAALATRLRTPNREAWIQRLRDELATSALAVRLLDAPDAATLAQVTAGLDPLQRGTLEEMAVIVAGDAAPKAWKKAAMADSLPGWAPYWADGAPKR